MGADPAAAIPGLLAAIAADHEYRPPLDRLRHLLEQHAELVGPAVPPLVGLLARPARPYRRDLLNLLADLARQLRTRCDGAADHGRPAAFAAAAPALVGMLADPDRYVRMLVPYVLCTIGGTGPGVPGALLARAARESDGPALVSLLRAAGELTPQPPAELRGRLAPWLGHEDGAVRPAVIGALGGQGGPHPAEGTAGLGRLAAEALATTGPEPWRHTPWATPRPGIVGWLTGRLLHHPEECADLITGTVHSPSAALRRDAVQAARLVLTHLRTPPAGLWETVAGLLDDEDRQVVDEAARLLADAGPAAAPFADRLAGALHRLGDGPVSGDGPLGALARLGDHRALPALRGRVAKGPLFALPGSVEDTLRPFRDEPTSLLRTVRGVLRRRPTDETNRPLLRALADWGPAAAPAVPALTGLLTTGNASWACAALGAIGPAARPAAERLEALATGRRVPPRHDESGRTRREPVLRPWYGAQTAAWAHWRVTGDPRTALHVIGAAARAGLGHPNLRYLADLGPAAREYADDVRPLLTAPGVWTRVEAAHAWWRLTGEPGPAVAALVRVLASGRPTPALLPAVRYLGAVGPAAVSAEPVLAALLSSPLRVPKDVGVRSVSWDEELCRALERALGAVRTGSPADSRTGSRDAGPAG